MSEGNIGAIERGEVSMGLRSIVNVSQIQAQAALDPFRNPKWMIGMTLEHARAKKKAIRFIYKEMELVHVLDSRWSRRTLFFRSSNQAWNGAMEPAMAVRIVSPM